MDQDISNLDLYYASYSCVSGKHKLTWVPEKWQSNIHNCTICNNNISVDFKYLIRWTCQTCNTYYCSTCRPIINIGVCPIKHPIIYLQDQDYSKQINWICDSCGTLTKGILNVYHDKVCDIGFCESCGKED